MDDSFAEPVSEKTVLRERNAYVLFYSRSEVKLELPTPPARSQVSTTTTTTTTNSNTEDTHSTNETINRNDSELDEEQSTQSKKKRKKKKKKDKSRQDNTDSIAASPVSTKTTDSLDGPGNRMATGTADPTVPAKKEEGNGVLVPASDGTDPITNRGTTTTIKESKHQTDDGETRQGHRFDGPMQETSMSEVSQSLKPSETAETKPLSKEAPSNASAPSSISAVEKATDGRTLKAKIDSNDSKKARTDRKKPVTRVTLKRGGTTVDVMVGPRNKHSKPWKPGSSLPPRASSGHDLLGSTKVGSWDEAAEPNVSNSYARRKAIEQIKTKDRQRKRKHHLDRWDSILDQGKVSRTMCTDEMIGDFNFFLFYFPVFLVWDLCALPFG